MPHPSQTQSVPLTDRLLDAAIDHHRNGRLAQAEPAYQELLKHDANNIDGLRLFGALCLQLNQSDRAEGYLRRALRIRTGDAEILNNLGVAQRNLGKTGEAIASFEHALRSRPNYPDALNNLGNAYHLLGKFNEALGHYERAIVLQPNYATAIGNLANVLRDMARFEEASARYDQALQAVPDNFDWLINWGITLHQLGKHDDAVARYEKALLLRPDHPSALANLGNLLREMGRTKEAITCFERALQIKPDYPEALVNLGAAWWDANEPEKTLACYEKALELRPDFTDALVNLGAIWWDRNRPDKALECYQRALAINPAHIEAIVNYGTVLWAKGEAEASRAKYDEALRLQPNHLNALVCLGALHHDENDFEGALAFYNRALGYNPACAPASWRKSLILLAGGNYNEGWKLYETGLGIRSLRCHTPFHNRRWDGSPAPGKRLLIWGEQGLGDSLQFVRYGALCKERVASVRIFCPKPLQRLFSNLPWAVQASNSVDDGDYDLQASMMSLPHLFGTTLETVPNQMPYLFVDAEAQAKWQSKFSDMKGLKVGIVWAGNAREGQINANLTDRRRSMTLEHLKPLLDMNGVTFVNLQMGPPADQIDTLGLRSHVTDYMHAVEDFMDTAAIVQQLDLVITVDTSVAHLVGGLNKPVWILSRFDACWRWLHNRETSPWYPTARIFGQEVPGEWNPVIAKVKAALEKELSFRGVSG